MPQLLPYLGPALMAGGQYYAGQAGGGQEFPEQQFSQYGGPPPEFQELYDMILGGLGGPEGMSELLTAATPPEPGSVYESFMSNLAPMGADYTPERREAFVGDWIRRMISGEGATERAGEYRTRGREDVQRTYKGAYDALRERTASAGGRHSSAEAKAIAEGTLGYQTALGDVESRSAGYEDVLRQSMFGQGMGVQNMLEAMQRGDYTQMLQYGTGLLNTLGPQIQVAGMDQMNMQNLMQMLMQIGQGYGTTEEGPPWPDYMGSGTQYGTTSIPNPTGY